MKTNRLFLFALAAAITAASYGQESGDSRKTRGGGYNPAVYLEDEPDSVIIKQNGVPIEKHFFKYEAMPQGKKVTRDFFYQDSPDLPWSQQQYETQYDAQGKILLLIAPNSYKEEYRYNAQGQKTLCVKYRWDNTANEFTVSSRDYYEYDEHGNMTLNLDSLYNYNSTTNVWDTSFYNSKSEYEYDLQGNMTSQIRYQWFSSYSPANWRIISMDRYAYDAQGNMIASQYYTWNSSRNKWQRNIPRNEYEYDEQGRKTGELYYNSMTTSSTDTTFTAGYKYLWGYDAQGNLANYAVYKRDGSDWTLNTENVYEYNGQGQLTKDSYSKQISYSIDEWYVEGVLIIFNPPHVVSTYDVSSVESRTYDAQNRPKTIESAAYNYTGVLNGVELANIDNSLTTFYYADDSEGINPAATDGSPVVSVQYYDMQGKAVKTPRTGLYIVKEVKQSGKVTSKLRFY
ncbi:MAG: hypothetical protein LBR34_11370 [Prevotella sp.]|jgi:YD repeat-containing protein|nr:hypothetical protein [Prevotella sp.]